MRTINDFPIKAKYEDYVTMHSSEKYQFAHFKISRKLC